MTDSDPTFFARLWLALACLFRVVYDVEFARRVGEVRSQLALQAGPPAPAALPAAASAQAAPFLAPAPVSASGQAASSPAAGRPAPAAPAVDPNAQALHLLALLQREGRLLDFLEEELAGFGDATIGAAARTVHSGCRKALRDAFDLKPVRAEAEGAAVELPAGFDAASVRLTGNVVGSPPFKGVLRHHGWRAAEVKLGPPPAGQPGRILAPAEVELS